MQSANGRSLLLTFAPWVWGLGSLRTPCSSLLGPWVLRRVGVHGRAAVSDGLWAQLVVPGLVAVDLAEPVRGAVGGQPCRGVGGPEVDRVARHVSRRRAGGHPSRGFRFRAVLRDRLAA